MGNFLRIFVASILTVSSLAAPLAHATTEVRKKDFDISSEQTFNLPPPSQIAPHHLEEMNRIYNNCMVDEFDSAHRDCKCFSMAFLEERLKLPNVNKEVVFTAINNSCYNPDTMAGYYYNNCISTLDISIIDTTRKDPVTLCECFGKSVAEDVPKLQNLNFKTLIKLQTKAYRICKFFD